MDFINKFKQYLLNAKEKPSKSTVKNYVADVRKFVTWFSQKHGSGNLELVNILTINEFADSRKNNSSLKSIDRNLSSLRKFFYFLKIEGIISESPFEQITKKQPEDPYLFKDFKNYLYIYNASKLTIKNYIIDIRQFMDWFIKAGQIDKEWNIKEKNVLNKINAEVIGEYKKRLMEKGFSPLSVNRKLSSLRKYCAWIKEEKIQISSLKSNPAVENNILPLKSEIGSYSSFAPFRFFQKLSKITNYIFDKGLIIPLVNLFSEINYLIWKTKGKHILDQRLTRINKPVYNVNNDRSTDQQISNISKHFYAPLKISTRFYPIHKKIIHHLRHTRPKWYLKYHSYPISHYFHFAVLIIFMSILGFIFYQKFILEPRTKNLSLASGDGPSTPPRILSFQGRLTDSTDNPIASQKNIRFAVYDSLTATGSSHLLWQEVDPVTPDSDGIFSVLLGNTTKDCASPLTIVQTACKISQGIFANNTTLYLGITIESDSELSPRQQLATVAYATNAELLQGLPPITTISSHKNTVLALNSSGNLSIPGSDSTTFQANDGEFKISGKVLSLLTNTSSNTSIQITPDGTGIIDLQKPIKNTTGNNNISTAAGSVEIDDLFSVLATSSGQTAFTINQNGTAPIISASSSGIAKFTLSNDGSGYFAGNLGVGTPSPASALDIFGTAQLRGSSTSTGLYVDSIGNVGVGTTSPVSLLDINSKFNVLSSGNVGVGTSSPSSKLQVVGDIASTTFNGLAITNNGTNTLNIAAGKTFTVSNTLTLQGTDSTTMTFPSSSATVAGLGITQTFTGSNTFNDNLVFGGGQGILKSDGNVGIGTTNPGTAGLSVMTGNIGIGTTSPTQKLEVLGNINISTGSTYKINGTDILSSTTLGSSVVTSSLTTVGALASGSIASGFGSISTGDTITTTGTMGTAGITTFTGAGATFSANINANGGLDIDDAFVIADGGALTTSQTGTFNGNLVFGGGQGILKSDGNVGIGTTNPLSLLDVSGNFNIVSSGNVGIGTSSPQNKLDVAGTSAFGLYAGTNTAPANGMIISGNVGIGTSSPLTMLQVGQGDNAGDLTIVGTGTTCTIGNGTNATLCSSDIRLKTNITALDSSLEKIMALKPVNFRWINPKKNQAVNLGFIAQDVQTVFPEFVKQQADGYLGLDYAGLIVPAIKAIQEQEIEISNIKSTINSSWGLAIELGDVGSLNIASQSGDFQQIKDSILKNAGLKLENIKSNNTINSIGSFASVVSFRIKSGLIETENAVINGFLAVKNIAADNFSAATGKISDLTVDSLAITSDSVSIGGQNLKDYISLIVEDIVSNGTIKSFNNEQFISPLASIEQIKTNVISPLSSDTIIVDGHFVILSKAKDLDSSPARPDQNDIRFEIQNSSGSAVATINSTGSASFSGTLAAADASISGTLRAGSIIADNIMGLDDKIASLSSYSAQLTYIDNLNSNFGAFNQGLISLGSSSFSDIAVSGQFLVGDGFILANNSINTFGNTLEIQPLKQSPISMMGGAFYIGTDGSLKINENAEFAKDVQIKGTLSAGIIAPVPDSDLIFKLSSPSGSFTSSASSSLVIQNSSGSAVLTVDQKGNINSSGSASFTEILSKSLNIIRSAQADTSMTETIATASAGTAVIITGETERTIISPYVKENSLIYITPTSDTFGLTPYIARQTAEIPEGDKSLPAGRQGSFTIQIPRKIFDNININWWIVN